MNYEFKPLIGAGDLSFGQSRSEARQHVIGRYKTLSEKSSSSTPTDYFYDEGVFLHYDSTGSLEAIEFSSPACLLVNSKCFIGMHLDEALTGLTDLTQNLQRDADGATAEDIGLGLYAPHCKDDPKAPVEGLIVFRSGYYDQ